MNFQYFVIISPKKRALNIGSLCNIAFTIERFSCIVTSQVFVKSWMQWSTALSSVFIWVRKHLWIIFSFKFGGQVISTCTIVSGIYVLKTTVYIHNCSTKMFQNIVNLLNEYQSGRTVFEIACLVLFDLATLRATTVSLKVWYQPFRISYKSSISSYQID